MPTWLGAERRCLDTPQNQWPLNVLDLREVMDFWNAIGLFLVEGEGVSLLQQ
jgi:hypothetical protein